MIHKYKMNGANIVIDVNSGAVHVVDDTVYDMLDVFQNNDFEKIKNLLCDKYSEDEIKESYEEIKDLVEQGIMFTEDINDKIIRNVNNRDPVVKALCLHIAHDCNLRCKYCFADEGEYHGHRSLMSAEVGKKAIDFIINNSGKRKNLEIDFFGGEPTMNLDVVKEIVRYGREVEKNHNKNFRFTLTTNGVLIDEDLIKYVNENMHNVVLSIDGRKSVNDNMRKRVGGQGSYDTIVPKFQKLAESRNQDNYYVRGTFTRENLDFSKDVLHMADLGFKQVSVEPVVSDPSEEYSLREEDLPIIFEEYEKLAVELIKRKQNGNGFNFFHFMIDLTGGPCVAKRLVGCGAGTEYLAVTPEGDLYPCHQFVGKEEFKMGDLDTGVVNIKQRAEFEACNVYAKDECRNCWAKFYCSGGCAANAHNAHNDILKPYDIGCEMQKKRTECAIMMKVKEQF